MLQITAKEDRIKALVKMLNLDSLKGFAKNAPDSILKFVLDELEARMPEPEFVIFCDSL